MRVILVDFRFFLILLGFFLLSPVIARADSVDDLMAQAKYNEAIVVLNQDIAAEPDNAASYRRLGSVYLRGLRNSREATKYFEKAIALNSELAEAYIEMGLAFESEGNLDKAASFYHQGLEFTRNNYWRQIVQSHIKAIKLSVDQQLLKDWLIAGPFENVNGNGLRTAYEPETSAFYNKWVRVFNPNSFGYVDLNNLFQANDFVVAYGLGYIYSPNERNVQFRIGSDDGIVVWLNNEIVLRKDLARSAILDSDIVPVRLKEGWNKVMLKVSDTWGDWGFYFRLTDNNGQPIPDIIFSADPKEKKIITEVRYIKYEYEARKRLIYAVNLISLAVFFIGVYLAFSSIRRRVVLNRMKTEFISNVLHELNTPLTAIRLSAETLNKKIVKAGGQPDNYCDIIKLNCQRLTMFIDNLHDFSLLRRGPKKFPRETTDIKLLAEEAIALVKTDEAAKDFEIILDCAQALPEILLHRSAMMQVFVNLINNAIRYSDKVKKIWVKVYAKKKVMVIEIKDQGVGIAKKDLARVFEKFYRTQAAEAVYRKGSGIGLFIVKLFVQMHGGRINLESEVNKGSTFRIGLPFK